MREMEEKGVESKDALSKAEILSQKLKGFNLERKFLFTQDTRVTLRLLLRKLVRRWRQRSFRNRRVGRRPPPRELLRYHYPEDSEAHQLRGLHRRDFMPIVKTRRRRRRVHQEALQAKDGSGMNI